ncbi:two-component system, cell cycle sensor histidine kinase and response regulator CckA [Paracoccus aminovorans]|uniref:histidine kinase n=1 Tax=Paracoccus aminovorans TaxID=34004 RepID=A0A1I3BKA4_9RHOB|nr:ATP-binding protein [Paracoccus aminovorans]CQR87056.1 two-component system, cell cycle sensor histidine kinase and response regulator CckA [Paracoccus aminovorans]SFH62727.1 two-component system, cell cycle sensor histidine kinase and response regulator CckA [Paracoccus aminovorans]
MISERAEILRSAQILVPFLALPALVGALWLALWPQQADAGATLLVAGAAASAWYLLGGAISARHLWRGLAVRRDLGRTMPAVLGHDLPALAIDPQGLILAQNELALDRLGDLVGRYVLDLLGRRHADPEAEWRDLGIRLARCGRLRTDLGDLGHFQVTREAGALVQLWLAATPEPAAAPAEPAPRSDGEDFDLLPVALITLDPSARVLRANAAACQLLGADIAGQSLAVLLDGLGRELGDWVGDICAGRTVGGAEVLHVKAEGPERFVQATLARGSGDYVTAVLSDASALKTLEAQFVQSQKMQAIGQLAGGIAHDFNNLLTAITGHCDLLMLRHDKADPDYADLDQISQNANRAAALVRQLLAFSRKQTLKPQIMDLRDTLSDLTHLLNRLVGERIVLTFDHDPSLRMIRADRRQFEQVIMNLVVNARDAMPEGGDITISTDNVRLEDPAGIGRATLPRGDYVRVKVRDQGCGIAPDDLAKIFEPFFTTKRMGEGTGLGLSTAYGIVKQTGGYIFCDSTPGEGSCFSLFFPAHDRGTAEEPAAPAASAPIRARRELEATVLLVEDEAPVRAFASRALKLQGFNVLEAACAEDALSLLSDQRLLVDVFVTDVVMPGMDGPSWVRTALRDRPDTRVIFMSGYAEDIFSEGRPPVPDSAFLAKPFSLSDLTALVARQLEGAGR